MQLLKIHPLLDSSPELRDLIIEVANLTSEETANALFDSRKATLSVKGVDKLYAQLGRNGIPPENLSLLADKLEILRLQIELNILYERMLNGDNPDQYDILRKMEEWPFGFHPTIKIFGKLLEISESQKERQLILEKVKEKGIQPSLIFFEIWLKKAENIEEVEKIMSAMKQERVHPHPASTKRALELNSNINKKRILEIIENTINSRTGWGLRLYLAIKDELNGQS